MMSNADGEHSSPHEARGNVIDLAGSGLEKELLEFSSEDEPNDMEEEGLHEHIMVEFSLFFFQIVKNNIFDN
jgi:hypothetical protein